MKLRIIAFLVLCLPFMAKGQSIYSTFQGEIEGVSSFFLHLEGDSTNVTGFYKFPSDDKVTPLKGSIDAEGNISLVGTESPFLRLEGKIGNKLVEGNIVNLSKNKTYSFYAVNLRGEYSCGIDYEYIRFSLLDNGYLFQQLSRTILQEFVTTQKADDGKVYVICDSLNLRFRVDKDTLVLQEPVLLAEIFASYEYLNFTTVDSFYSGESFVEFPEKGEGYLINNPTERRLNNTCTIRSRQIPQSEYVVKRWQAKQYQHPPYKVITDAKEAIKMLSKYVKRKKVKDHDFDLVELRFKDGGKKEIYGEYDKFALFFIAYCPELKVLVLDHEASGDDPYDLNDSKIEHVGHPSYYKISPDKQLRIARFYPGGAADDYEFFLEKWNKATRRYEYVGDISGMDYVNEYFWGENNTILFSPSRYSPAYVQLDIIFDK